MTDRLVNNPIFSPLKQYLQQAGVSASDVNAFIKQVVGLINDSDTLKAEISALTSNGLNWTIGFLQKTGNVQPNAAQTYFPNSQIQINFDPTNLINSSNNPNFFSTVNTFVGNLAYELGHAEDLQENTKIYSGNTLAVGAEVALEMLSESKSLY